MAVTVAAAIVLISACGPRPSGPSFAPLPSPTPDAVVPVTTADAETSVRPMSADGRFVAYTQGVPGTGVRDGHLWDASDGSTTALTDGAAVGAPAGSRTEPPFVSSDGSTVVFTSNVPVVGGQPNAGNSFFVYSVSTGATQQVPVPAAYGAGPIDSVSTSGDGGLVVVSYGDKVLTWTAGSGFGELTDPARLAAGTAHSFSAVGAPVSDSGRFVTVMAVIARPFDGAPGSCKRPEVHDLEGGGSTLGTCIDKDFLPPPGTRFARVPVLATTDQGEVVFAQADLGVRIWSPARGPGSLTSKFTYGWTAASDGNAVGYSPQLNEPGGGEGTGFLMIRDPRSRAQLGRQAFRTKAVGIGAGAEKVLLSSREPDVVGEGADNGRALYVWTRSD